MERGDRRGATRLACFYFGAVTIAWLFAEHHAPAGWELDRFVGNTATTLFYAGMLWLTYVALEPYPRCRWPELLVALNRVFTGS